MKISGQTRKLWQQKKCNVLWNNVLLIHRLVIALLVHSVLVFVQINAATFSGDKNVSYTCCKLTEQRLTNALIGRQASAAYSHRIASRLLVTATTGWLRRPTQQASPPARPPPSQCTTGVNRYEPCIARWLQPPDNERTSYAAVESTTAP